MDFLCGKRSGGPEQFILDSVVFELEKNIKVKTVALRKSYKIKLPDAIIAAIAIVNGLTLLTRDAYDFQNISDLSFINSWNK